MRQSTSDGFAPLTAACRSGSEQIVSLLLQKGADVDRGDFQRWTALHECAQHNRKGCAVQLIEGLLFEDSLVKNAFFYSRRYRNGGHR